MFKALKRGLVLSFRFDLESGMRFEIGISLIVEASQY